LPWRAFSDAGSIPAASTNFFALLSHRTIELKKMLTGLLQKLTADR
jgi:hypothetical protein